MEYLVTIRSQALFATPLATFDVGDPFSPTLSLDNISLLYEPFYYVYSPSVSTNQCLMCLRLPGVSHSVCVCVIWLRSGSVWCIWECLKVSDKSKVNDSDIV